MKRIAAWLILAVVGVSLAGCIVDDGRGGGGGGGGYGYRHHYYHNDYYR